MFYLFNVQAWLEEIIDTCGNKGLDPGESIFCLTLFSSLDAAYVKFFRTRKEQISSYSGENVHLFTPIIYDNDIIPDNEVRSLRRKFSESGVNLGTGPSIIIFNLKKRDLGSGYDPEYIGAFDLPEGRHVTRLMRNFVSICIEKRSSPEDLLAKLSEELGKPNLLRRRVASTAIRLTAFKNPLHAPTVFLSYNHADSDKVLRVYDALRKHGLHVWLDKYEIKLGENILEKVKRGLDGSDAALLFLSANSENSVWLPFEGAYLQGKGEERRIISIVLDEEGKALACRLPLAMGRLYFEIYGNSQKDEALERLAEKVKEALGVS